MSNRFFNPFIGENYNLGINGKRVLVVGASFYCTSVNCFFLAIVQMRKQKIQANMTISALIIAKSSFYCQMNQSTQ